MRTIIHVLSCELFGESLVISDFPTRKDITGLGLSDWAVYAERLEEKLGYVNTFLDKEPRLDIRSVGEDQFEPVDFLIATDVFEHVAPPVSLAFENSRRLLKPGGLIVFSVPYVVDQGVGTREHFPDLHQYAIVDAENGTRALLNTTRDGRKERFENLVFHGGDGLTLEMRVFSEGALRWEFGRAGFRDVRFYPESYLRFGVRWPVPWSLVMSARAA